MEKSSCLAFGARIYYRPIEAAVRWAGLLRFEPRILETLGPRAMPEPNDFPRWPLLRLFSERIWAHSERALFEHYRQDRLTQAELPFDDPSF